jgi:sugar phosphate isomerase/epimerase
MTPFSISRRALLAAAASSALAAPRGAAADSPAKMGLGFSLYGMKTLTIRDAIAACAEIGYDTSELPVMKDWPADSSTFSRAEQRKLRAQLQENNLRLSALMENLPALGDMNSHAANLARLGRAAELASELAANGRPAVIETILGGKAGAFETVKSRLVERLKDWSAVVEKAQVTLAVKAHVSNATQRPEQLEWLLKQVASPYVKAA